MAEQAQRPDREPSDADRPPASRVGDELQSRADEADEEPSDERVESIEEEAYEEAQKKGWDKDLTDTD